jgi:hypothetical protein
MWDWRTRAARALQCAPPRLGRPAHGVRERRLLLKSTRSMPAATAMGIGDRGRSSKGKSRARCSTRSSPGFRSTAPRRSDRPMGMILLHRVLAVIIVAALLFSLGPRWSSPDRHLFLKGTVGHAVHILVAGFLFVSGTRSFPPHDGFGGDGVGFFFFSAYHVAIASKKNHAWLLGSIRTTYDVSPTNHQQTKETLFLLLLGKDLDTSTFV